MDIPEFFIHRQQMRGQQFPPLSLPALRSDTTSDLKLHHPATIVAAVCDRRWANETALTERRYSAISN